MTWVTCYAELKGARRQGKLVNEIAEHLALEAMLNIYVSPGRKLPRKLTRITISNQSIEDAVPMWKDCKTAAGELARP